MKRKSHRGSALAVSMTVLVVTFVTGAGVLSLSMQSMRRGRLDALRARALALAEAGAEKAIYYLRTTAPNGSVNGAWRTTGFTETIANQGDYTIVVQDGAGENAGKVVVTSTGIARDGAVLTMRRAVRVAMKLDEEDISVWNNVIFGGVGQTGRSINGNIAIRGNVHLLGDGETFTDVDHDGHWDAGETYTDLNLNGHWDLGELFVDTDGDGRFDTREPFDDVNGNSTRDPALTVTDLSSEISGDANIGNNYDGMPSGLRNLLPAVDPTPFNGESVQSLKAKLRVKHGRVDISGSASVGEPQATGGSPPVKETMDGVFVNDGFGGNQGTSQVYSDNGTRQKYNLGNMVTFPTLTEPTVQGGVSYLSYMSYLQTVGLNIVGPLTLQPGTAYGPVSDGKGNSFQVDTAGNISIQGIVYVNGDITLNRNGGNQTMHYSGRGTLVSTGNVYAHTDLTPSSPTFPTNSALGVIGRHRVELATGAGDSQLTLAGAFYAQEQVVSQKQNEIAGSFVASYFSMQNVPHMYQVPALSRNLPPGMPGSGLIVIKTIRIDSWREVAS